MSALARARWPVPPVAEAHTYAATARTAARPASRLREAPIPGDLVPANTTAAQMVLLSSDGYPAGQIAAITHHSDDTVCHRLGCFLIDGRQHQAAAQLDYGTIEYGDSDINGANIEVADGRLLYKSSGSARY
jgi:hypothetical protein